MCVLGVKSKLAFWLMFPRHARLSPSNLKGLCRTSKADALERQQLAKVVVARSGFLESRWRGGYRRSARESLVEREIRSILV